MSRVNVAIVDIVDTVCSLLPVLDTDQGKAFYAALGEYVKHAGDDMTEWGMWFTECAKVYLETELTDDDKTKIKLLDKDIDKLAKANEQTRSKCMLERQEELIKAIGAGESTLASSIMDEYESKALKQNAKRLAQIDTLDDDKTRINNKRVLTARAKLIKLADMRVSTAKDRDSSDYAFEGQTLYVECTRKTALKEGDLAWGVDWVYHEPTRRIFVRPTGDGYTPEMHGKWYFAGMLADIDGKNRIGNMSKLARANYTWINIASKIKPTTPEDLYQVTLDLNARAVLGNLSEGYTGGAEYAYRLVDTLVPDASHQKLLSDYASIEFDKLEEHKAKVAELAKADEKAA